MLTYYAGSKHIKDLLLANKDRIVCNIHGHTHDGAFIQNIWKPKDPLPVINPGSLSQGEFGEITLRKSIISGKWKVSESTKFYLDGQ
jgi:Icc-related predicted phosphoesterase